jgi:hypothetical protein
MLTGTAGGHYEVIRQVSGWTWGPTRDGGSAFSRTTSMRFRNQVRAVGLRGDGALTHPGAR